MGEVKNVPASTGNFFHSQNCNFPEEGFILSSFCKSAGSPKQLRKTTCTALLRIFHPAANRKKDFHTSLFRKIKVRVLFVLYSGLKAA
jgi:hypothetical protein